jgi:hypothetical protein
LEEKADMKKRFSEEQIIGFQNEAEAGVPVKELCGKHGFSDASFYACRLVGLSRSVMHYETKLNSDNEALTHGC